MGCSDRHAKAVRDSARPCPHGAFPPGAGLLDAFQGAGAFEDKVRACCDAALGLAVPVGDALCWEHPFGAHGQQYKSKSQQGGQIPDSCAHNTIRLGMLLQSAGRALPEPSYAEAAGRVMAALMQLHRWRSYPGGGQTMSYYPLSDDEIINISVETAKFLATVPGPERSPEMNERILGAVRMAMAEQREDGCWNYNTRRHAESYGMAPTPPTSITTQRSSPV